MKRIKLYFIIMMLFLSADVLAKKRIIRKGSEDGYNYNRVSETHNWFNHTLECYDPGNVTCGWYGQCRVINSASGELDANEISDWVMRQILDNHLSNGKVLWSDSQDVLVIWQSTGTTANSEIIIDIYEPGDEFPY